MKCALCLKEKQLIYSHIIPEFFFKSLYDENHHIRVVPLQEGESKRYIQKGPREKLLCEKCDIKISKYEDYVKRFFYGITRKEIGVVESNPLKFINLDYKNIKLFQLSLLYRAAVSKSDFYQAVNLGPHKNTIRQMLVEERPGNRNDYPCIIYMILLNKMTLLDELITQPMTLRIEGQRVFRFFFGGCFWFYFVSKHTDRLLHREYYLKEDGSVLIPVRNAEDTPYFQDLARNVAKYNF